MSLAIILPRIIQGSMLPVGAVFTGAAFTEEKGKMLRGLGLCPKICLIGMILQKKFCLCLKWEKSPGGNKTLKFYHYWRIYMLWILNSGFSTCYSCSEAIQIIFFFLFLMAIRKHWLHHPLQVLLQAVLIVTLYFRRNFPKFAPSFCASCCFPQGGAPWPAWASLRSTAWM